MTPIVPRIAVFSTQPVNTCLSTNEVGNWLAKHFEIHRFNCDIEPSFLINGRFSVLVIIGNKHLWPLAAKSTLPILYLDSPDEITGDKVYSFYISTLEDYNPSISIFTPAHNTFEKFNRCY